MIMLLYSVHDKASGAFLPPFCCRSIGEAVRSFESAVSDPQHQFHKYVSDYVLFFVGEYDDVSGLISSREPERIMSAIEVLPSQVG